MLGGKARAYPGEKTLATCVGEIRVRRNSVVRTDADGNKTFFTVETSLQDLVGLDSRIDPPQTGPQFNPGRWRHYKTAFLCRRRRVRISVTRLGKILPFGYFYFSQGILKGGVSLYCWPPVWLFWNKLYDNWQFLFLFSKQANPNRSNRRSTVQWYFPLKYSLLEHFIHFYTNEEFQNKIRCTYLNIH